VPQLTGVHHVTVPTSDPLAGSDWYARVFDFATVLIEERESEVVAVLLQHRCGVRLLLRRAAAPLDTLSGYPLFGLSVATHAEFLRWVEHVTLRSSDRMGIEMVVPREVFFDSAGVRCAADLYWPDAVTGSVACVVMGHGGSGTKRLGLPKDAKAFAAAGLAVLAFDYRRFGSSDGLPRQVIDVAVQREDYRAAVRFARSLDGTDPRRIALWGTSLSGSHVLAVAPFAPSSSPPPRSVM